MSQNFSNNFAEIFYERIELIIQDQVAHVTMKRAEKLNALDLAMMKGLKKAAQIIKKDKNIRAVLLSGDGSSFCAGLDFSSVMSKPWKVIVALFKYGKQTNLFQEVAWCWRNMPVPVIALTKGNCFGGGMQIALGADFRFSTADCRFSVMEGKWGLIPDMTASVTLRELVGIDVAKELTMTARIISAQEAKNYGLITRICENPEQEALELIEEIKLRSPDSVALTKELFHRTWNAKTRWAFAIETWLQVKLLLGKNQKIAMQANFKKINAKYLSRQ